MGTDVGNQILSELCSDKKLERDRGLEKLKAVCSSAQDKTDGNEAFITYEFVRQGIFDRLENFKKFNEDATTCWEERFGYVSGGSCMVSAENFNNELDDFSLTLRDVSTQFLTDSEPRVRLAAAEAIGSLCKKFGPSVYAAIKSTVLAVIHANIVREASTRSRTTSLSSSYEDENKDALMDTLPLEADRDASEVLHDTAGWRSLETSMKCLQLMVEGCGADFIPHMDADIFDLLALTLDHQNRFVRETGYYLLGALIECGCIPCESKNPKEDNEIFIRRMEITGWLTKGLGDNWSQVRLAGSVATRKMLKLLEYYPEISAEILRHVVPPMCLNRYYLAEGVRLYSHESWRILTEGQIDGTGLVSSYIKEVCAYYIAQTKADNHAVREAACHAITELALKVETSALASEVGCLLEALTVCFEDESWPVRDAACIASARFLKVYPDAGVKRLDQLLPLFWAQLEDCIPSVRQGAAESLAILCASYENIVIDWVWPKLQEGLRKIHDQPADSEDLIHSAGRYTGLSSGPAMFGVAMRIRANDPEVHTGQEMYSCGSLAPKMRAGGCMDHGFRRPPTPWETSDGCVQLLAEFSQCLPSHASGVSELFTELLESCRKRDFVHHVQFLATVCKRIPQFAKSLGKRYFKPHLQGVFEPVFYSLNCGCELTQVAAEECLRSLANIFGPSIIRGRIEMLNNLSYLEQYSRLIPTV